MALPATFVGRLATIWASAIGCDVAETLGMKTPRNDLVLSHSAIDPADPYATLS